MHSRFCSFSHAIARPDAKVNDLTPQQCDLIISIIGHSGGAAWGWLPKLLASK
jgi:hypothetical protein